MILNALGPLLALSGLAFAWSDTSWDFSRRRSEDGHDHGGSGEWFAVYEFPEEGKFQFTVTKNSSVLYDAGEFKFVIMKKLDGVHWPDFKDNGDALFDSAPTNVPTQNGGDLQSGAMLTLNTTDAPQNHVAMTADAWSTTVLLNVTESGEYVVFVKPMPPNAKLDGDDGIAFITSPDGNTLIPGHSNHEEEHHDDQPEEGSPLSNAQLWGYSLAGTFIGMAAAFGGALIILKIHNVMFIEQPLLWFSSGVIISVSCLHLLGETGELNNNGWPHNTSLATCLVAGLFIGFGIEAVLKECCGVTDHGHGGAMHDPKLEAKIQAAKEQRASFRAQRKSIEMQNTLDGGNSPSVKGLNGEAGGRPSFSRRLSARRLSQRSVITVVSERNHEAISWTVILADALHNTFDGFIIAEAFDNCGSSKGWALSFAILAHELPQEMSDFYVLIKGGWSWQKALFANFMVSCTAIIGVIMYLGLKDSLTNHDFSFFLAFSTGGFLFIGVDLISHIQPGAKEHHPLVLFICFWLGWGIIYALMEWHPECHVLVEGADGEMSDPHAGHNHG